MALDETLHAAFDEDQIYRIDHYMGKETVQNILALRFANSIFEPIWNRRYVGACAGHGGREPRRRAPGRLLREAGALRDIVQNHVMQVLALTLMEPPATHRRRPRSATRRSSSSRPIDGPTPDEAVDRSSCAASTWRAASTASGARLPRGGGRRPRTPDRDVRRHPACASTTGAGPGCPSTCAPASACPPGSTEVALTFRQVALPALRPPLRPRTCGRTR